MANRRETTKAARSNLECNLLKPAVVNWWMQDWGKNYEFCRIAIEESRRLNNKKITETTTIFHVHVLRKKAKSMFL